MAYFRISFGGDRAERDAAPAFGFAVRREFRFDDPLYAARLLPFQASGGLTAEMLDLRFGMNGGLDGIRIGGFDALRFGNRLNAAAAENPGTPDWVWYGLGAVAIGAAIIFATSSGDDGEEMEEEGGGQLICNPITGECVVS